MNISRPLVLIFLSIAFLASGCHTLLESSSGSSSEQKTVNKDGETVYRRVTPAYQAYVPPPLPTPSYHDRPSTQPVHTITPTSESSPQTKPATSVPPTSRPDSHGEPSRGSGHIETAWVEGNVHLGGHLGYNITDWFMPRIGASLFVSKDVYWGIDLSTRFILPLGYFRPFVGLGGYFGDTKSCSRQFDATLGYVDVCDKKFLNAGFGEAGVEFGTLSIFVRDYRVTRAGLSVPTNIFVGFGMRFQ